VAQRVEVVLTCDAHDGEVAGTETMQFGLDGTSYEIDLCAEHAEELREGVEVLIHSGRKSGRGGTSRPRKRPAESAGDGSDIRSWARANGHAVSERGRIAAAVQEAYRAAH